MTWKVIIGAVIIATVAIFIGRAEAQTGRFCATIAVLDKFAKESFGEVPIWRGKSINSSTGVTLYHSADGSWTVAFVNAAGIACVIATGTHGVMLLDAMPPPKPNPKEDIGA